jgi:hypothetical protein
MHSIDSMRWILGVIYKQGGVRGIKCTVMEDTLGSLREYDGDGDARGGRGCSAGRTARRFCRPSLRCVAELALGVAFATETAVENKDGDRRATAVASTTARRCRAHCGAVVFLGSCLSPVQMLKLTIWKSLFGLLNTSSLPEYLSSLMCVLKI